MKFLKKIVNRLFKRSFKLKNNKPPKSLLAEHMRLVTEGSWVERMHNNKRLDHYIYRNNVVE